VIIEAVQSPESPLFLLLGSHALTNYRRVADARAAEIDRWEEHTTSADVDSRLGQNGNRTQVLSVAS